MPYLNFHIECSPLRLYILLSTLYLSAIRLFDSNLTLVHNKAKGKMLLAYRFTSLNGVYDF